MVLEPMWIGVVVVIAAVVGGMAGAAEPGVKNPPTTTPVEPNVGVQEQKVNVHVLGELAGRGGYVSLCGENLFLTSDLKRNNPQAGYWFDISENPAAPKLVADNLPGAWEVQIVDGHAVVCDYTKVLRIADLRQRTWTPAATLDMPDQTENVRLRGTLAYIANHTGGLTIVDLTSPAKPTIVSNINPKIDCDGIDLSKNHAILYGHWESRLVIVDISDPANPRQVGIYQHEKGSFNQGEVTVANGVAYCTSTRGLVIVNIADPANPTLIKSIAGPATSDVDLIDNYAFIASGKHGLTVLDVKDPANPVEVGRYAANGFNARKLAVRPVKNGEGIGTGYHIYAANGAGPGLVMLFRPPGR